MHRLHCGSGALGICARDLPQEIRKLCDVAGALGLAMLLLPFTGPTIELSASSILLPSLPKLPVALVYCLFSPLLLSSQTSRVPACHDVLARASLEAEQPVQLTGNSQQLTGKGELFQAFPSTGLTWRMSYRKRKQHRRVSQERREQNRGSDVSLCWIRTAPCVLPPGPTNRVGAVHALKQIGRLPGGLRIGQ